VKKESGRERMIKEESTTGRKEGSIRCCIVLLYIQQVTHMEQVYGHIRKKNGVFKNIDVTFTPSSVQLNDYPG
jgi:hypothetical protein